MRLHRFYINKPLGEELVVERAREEKEILHQWHNVFRYKSGDEVLLFSSHNPGKDFLYTMKTLSKEKCTLEPISTRNNIDDYPLSLAMALVKKDTFEQVVRHATELGVSKIIPIQAGRSEKKNLNFERLKAITIEASEQSGRGTVPEITDIMSIEQAFSLTKDQKNIVGSLQGSRTREILENEMVCVWIGPEGGWTIDEEAFFKKKGFLLTKTLDTVMKADTAAIHLLSIVLSHFHFRT